jgi:hypothetical protein
MRAPKNYRDGELALEASSRKLHRVAGRGGVVRGRKRLRGASSSRLHVERERTGHDCGRSKNSAADKAAHSGAYIEHSY